jgi:cytosine deaminase
MIANALLPDGTKRNVQIEGGKISALLPASETAQEDALNLNSALLLPPLVDGHIHLDKTLLGLPWVANRAGDTVASRIEAERGVRAERTVPEEETGANLVRQVMASGTLHMRTHVDIDNQLGLKNLHAILRLRERFCDLVGIQIVAFPQSGIVRSPGTAALLDAAIAEGADLVGGLDPIGIDGDLDGHLDTVFGIAQRRGVGIDIHLHDGGEGGIVQILGSAPTDLAASTADALAEAGVTIMSHGPGAATMPPLKLLRAHGVEVFGGSDNIRDAWSPFGNGDMLERAMMIGYRANFRRDEELEFAFDMVTSAAARVLGVEAYGIAVGAPADFVAVDASSVAEAVATRPKRKLVISKGHVIARDGVLVV